MTALQQSMATIWLDNGCLSKINCYIQSFSIQTFPYNYCYKHLSFQVWLKRTELCTFCTKTQWLVTGRWFLRILWFPPSRNWSLRSNRNIADSSVKHHSPHCNRSDKFKKNVGNIY